MKTKNKQKKERVAQAYLPLTPNEQLITQLSKSYHCQSWDWELMETACVKIDVGLCNYDFQVMEQSFQALASDCRLSDVEVRKAEVMLVRLYIYRLLVSLDLRPLFPSFTQWLENLLSFGYLLLMSYKPSEPDICCRRLECNSYRKAGAFWHAVFYHQLWEEDTLSVDTLIKQRCSRLYVGPLFDTTFDCVSSLENERWQNLKTDIAMLTKRFSSEELAQVDASVMRLRSTLFTVILTCCESFITELD